MLSTETLIESKQRFGRQALPPAIALPSFPIVGILAFGGMPVVIRPATVFRITQSEVLSEL